MASLEQSMMDFDKMAEDMMSHFPMRSHLIAAPGTSEDDEFFNDLPQRARLVFVPLVVVQSFACQAWISRRRGNR